MLTINSQFSSKFWLNADDKKKRQKSAISNNFLKFILINDLYNGNDLNNQLGLVYPINFDFNIYKKYNDLHNLNTDQLIHHYIHFGKKEGRIYKLPDKFNVNNYRLLNPDLKNLNTDQLISHYINFGNKEFRMFL